MYKVYHPLTGENNTSKLRGINYRLVATVNAENAEDAFKMSQNDFNPEYHALGIRNTSIGDILQSRIMEKTGECMMVVSGGFDLLSDDWLNPYQVDKKLGAQLILTQGSIIGIFKPALSDKWEMVTEYDGKMVKCYTIGTFFGLKEMNIDANYGVLHLFPRNATLGIMMREPEDFYNWFGEVTRKKSNNLLSTSL